MKPEIIEKIEQHYNHACMKHPDFVKRFGVEDEFDWSEFNLKMYRTKIETETKYNNLGLESILLCEVWEFFDAITNERFQEAIEESYDIIAVVLRAIERIKKLKVAKPEEVVVAKMETTTPRRNCDVYTMAEQSKRHEEYCKSHTTNGRCGKCPLWQMRLLGINCAVAWANFPYEKEGEK